MIVHERTTCTGRRASLEVWGGLWVVVVMDKDEERVESIDDGFEDARDAMHAYARLR